jgi:hypothetical protein
MRRAFAITLTAALSAGLLAVAPRAARAQDASATSASAGAQPSAADLRSAAEAYDQATRRYMRHDFVQAANWFEAADRLAPSMLALMGAVRAHRQLEELPHLVRAATLALRLQSRYPNDPRARALAQRTLTELAPRVSRVRVECNGCEIEIDGVLQSSADFFVAPGAHRARMRWGESETRDDAFEIAAGAEMARHAERPPPPASPPPPPPRHPPPQPFRFHVAVPIATGLATIGFAVGAAVSWVDALRQADALIHEAERGTFDANHEHAVYAAEDRTTGLLVTTIVLGAAAIGTAIFTRWRAPVVAPARAGDANMIIVTGRF